MNLSPSTERAIRSFPVLVTLIVGVLLALPSTQHLSDWVIRERGPVETATFVAFLTGGLYGLVLALRLRARGEPLWVWGWYVAVSALLVFSAGEEISWGQTLFGFKPPESWTSGNVQHEINVHNLPFLFDFNVIMVPAIGVVGLVAIWLGKRPALDRIAVPPILTIYFVLIVLIGGLDAFTDAWPIQIRFDTVIGWLGEVMEMLIGVSGMLYMLLNGRRLIPKEP